MSSPAATHRGPVLVDVTHGLDAGREALEGACLASLELDLPLSILGDEPTLTAALQDIPHDAEHLRVIHTPDTSPGAGLPAALRRAAERPGASVITAAPRADVLREARAALPTLPGITHPALAAVYPTARLRGERNDPFALLLDVGAHAQSDAHVLQRHALMGAIYARLIADNERPRVALLANDASGDNVPQRLREAAHHIDAQAGDRYLFTGLTDGSRVLLGDADVIVSDGYSGELLIRTIEGFAATAEQLLARAGRRFRWRMGVSMLGGGIEALRELTDWQNYGGAPLLGLTRPIVTLQTGARRRAFLNAARLVAKIERLGVMQEIADALAESPEPAEQR